MVKIGAVNARARVGLLISAVTVAAACGDRVELNQVGPTEPTTPTTPARPDTQITRRILGVAEVTFSDITSANMTAAIRVAPTVALLEQHRADADDPIQDVANIRIARTATGTFKHIPRDVDPIRFVRATFAVRNLRRDSAVFDPSRENVSFVAVRTNATIGATALRSIERLDHAAVTAAFAQRVIPSEVLSVDSEGRLVNLPGDVLQEVTPLLAQRTEAAAGTQGLVPYGFVVHRPPATTNPRADLLDVEGVVTFAFTLPHLSADNENITHLSVYFVIVNDTAAPRTP